MDSTPHPVLLLPDFYQEKLRRIFAEWALVWLKQQKCIDEGLRKATEAGLEVDKVWVLLF
jgi:hypothetical protein